MTNCRVVQRIVVFLLLGAVVNVAVAWALALLYPQFRVADGQRQTYPINREYWTVWTLHGFGYAIVRSEPMMMTKHVYLSEMSVSQYPALPNWWAWSRTAPSHWRESKCAIATGLPALGLCASYDRTEDTPDMRTSFARGGIAVSTVATCGHPDYNLARSTPLIPIWPGFAINTIFYAAILSMLFAFPFAMRRRRRIKRGLCPACAYPVGGSPVCTECGKPVKSTNTETQKAETP